MPKLMPSGEFKHSNTAMAFTSCEKRIADADTALLFSNNSEDRSDLPRRILCHILWH